MQLMLLLLLPGGGGGGGRGRHDVSAGTAAATTSHVALPADVTGSAAAAAVALPRPSSRIHTNDVTNDTGWAAGGERAEGGGGLASSRCYPRRVQAPGTAACDGELGTAEDSRQFRGKSAQMGTDVVEIPRGWISFARVLRGDAQEVMELTPTGGWL